MSLPSSSPRADAPTSSAAKFIRTNGRLLLWTAGLWSLAATTVVWLTPPAGAFYLPSVLLVLLYPLPTAALAVAAAGASAVSVSPSAAYRSALLRYPAVLLSTAVFYAAASASAALAVSAAVAMGRAGVWAPLVWLVGGVALVAFLFGVSATFVAPLHAALSPWSSFQSLFLKGMPLSGVIGLGVRTLPFALLERLFGRVPILISFEIERLSFLPRQAGLVLAAVSAAPLALSVASGAVAYGRSTSSRPS